MRQILCIGDYSNGKFETDSISVVSPKGGHRSVWLHYDNEARGFSESEREMFGNIVAKFQTAYANFNFRLSRGTQMRLRGEMIRLFGRGGLYQFLIALSTDELRLIDRMSDQSFSKTNRRR